MTSKTSKRFAAILLVLPVLGLMVLAQAQDEETTSEETTPEAEVDVQKQASLTPEEKLAEAEKVVQDAARIVKGIRNMVDDAQRGKDMIRLSCLNDKYTQANAASRNLAQRHEQLRNAVGAGNESESNHHFTVLGVWQQQLTVTEQEAKQCVGEDMFETTSGAAKVVTTTSPNTPTGDPTNIADLPEDEFPPIPPPASTVR